MGKVIYLMNVSLDGYVETPSQSLDWTFVDEELHSWFNDQMRDIDALVYGRLLYELMRAHWPTAEEDPAATPAMLEFARIMNPKPKVVFSRTLQAVDWNSRLTARDVGEELSLLKHEFAGDLAVAGPTLAAQFIERGLVDEYRLVVHPVILGAGKPFFPSLATPIQMRLIETHTFTSGVVYLRYAAV